MKRVLRESLGVKDGGVVFVHSSIERMNLTFSGMRLLQILKEAVGPEGTLLFPCTHVAGRAEDYLRSGAIFDVRKSPTCMGLLPELVRRSKGAARSLHPTNSVVAVGKHAADLVATHVLSVYPCDANSPYYKIVDYEGIIIGLGVGTERLSFVHCVEDILRDRFPLQTRTHQIFAAAVRDAEGMDRIVPTTAQTFAVQWRNIPRFMKRNIPDDICLDMVIDGVRMFRAKARELYVCMEKLALAGVTIYKKKAYSYAAKHSI